MSEPQCYKTPGEELIVKKCWSPPCPNVACFRDAAGWWFCMEHKDRAWQGLIEEHLKYDDVVKRARKLKNERDE